MFIFVASCATSQLDHIRVIQNSTSSATSSIPPIFPLERRKAWLGGDSGTEGTGVEDWGGVLRWPRSGFGGYFKWRKKVEKISGAEK